MNKINVAIYFMLILFCFKPSFVSGQEMKAEVAIQSGFTQDVLSSFEFSSNNKYLYGKNQENEHIIWDVATYKQIKRITPLITQFPGFFYFPKAVFSNDSKNILIPDFPSGEYALYNLQLNTELFRFVPPEAGLYYTHAFFSGNSDRIMLVLQSNAKTGIYRFEVRKLTGELIYQMSANFENPFSQVGDLTRLLIKKQIDIAENTALLSHVSVQPDFKSIAVSTVDNRLFKFHFLESGNGNLTISKMFQIPSISGATDIKSIKFTGDDLAILLEGEIKLIDKVNYLVTDTIVYINANRLDNQRKKVSKVIVPDGKNRTNIVSVETLTSDADLSIYFEDQVTGNDHIVVVKDFLSDKNIFSYKHGNAFNDNEPIIFKSGQFNGGKLVAISKDRSLIAECTANIVVYEAKSNSVSGTISPTKGNLRLFEPVFIDSSTIYFPRLSENGFLFNMKDGYVQSIGPANTCLDSAKNGRLSFRVLEVPNQLGMKTANYNPATKKIFQVDYRPWDYCGKVDTKNVVELSIGDSKPVRKAVVKHFQETYYVHPMPVRDRYIINYSIFDWKNDELVPVADFIIKEKRDSFFALMPQVIDNSGTVLGVLCDRKAKGSTDIIVATWDKDGKLLEKNRIKRKNSKVDYQSLLYEVSFSPDKKHLIYTTFDGVVGVYSIEKKVLLYETNLNSTLTLKANGIFKSWLNLQVTFGAVSACFTTNEKFVTTGSDSRIVEWSVKSNSPIRQVNQNDRFLFYTINRSPDGKYLYGVDIDKTVKFLDYTTGDLAFQFLSTDYTSYMVINKDGYYMTNKNAVNNLAYLYNGTTYNYNQFDAILNRPDKVLESIGYISDDKLLSLKRAFEMRLKRSGIAESSKAFQSAPSISVSTNEVKNSVESPTLQVKVTGVDLKSPIQKLWVRVNGIAIYGIKGKMVNSVAAKEGFKMETTITVPLSIDKNDIEISLVNAMGIESTKEFITINRKATKKNKKLYIVTIGSSKFKDASRNLQFADKDSKDILDYFIQPSPLFQTIVPISLTNEQVTREKILAIKKELAKSDVDDVVLLYYAGHGLISKSWDYYLSTFDIDFSAPEKRGIAFYEMEGIFDSIPARNRILFMDACHSGDFDKEEKQNEEKQRVVKGSVVFGAVQQQNIKSNTTKLSTYELMRQYFLDAEKGIGANIISSSSSREYSWEEGTVKNGLFTYCLLDGLKTYAADADKNGSITLTELQVYVSERVKTLSEGRQKPVSRADNQFYNLTLKTR